MHAKRLFVPVILIALSLMLIAGSCDAEKKKLKLGDIDSSLAKQVGTKWDGLKTQKVQYVVDSGNKDVDSWSKQAAVVYGSLVQAEHVVDIASKEVEKLKKNKDAEGKKEAEKAVKQAQDILEKAAANGPKLVQDGENLVKNYKKLISNPTKAGAMYTALTDSAKNLKETIDRAPKTIKKLGKIGKKLAKL